MNNTGGFIFSITNTIKHRRSFNYDTIKHRLIYLHYSDTTNIQYAEHYSESYKRENEHYKRSFNYRGLAGRGEGEWGNAFVDGKSYFFGCGVCILILRTIFLDLVWAVSSVRKRIMGVSYLSNYRR